jgi:hypothetical protein
MSKLEKSYEILFLEKNRILVILFSALDQAYRFFIKIIYPFFMKYLNKEIFLIIKYY